MTAYSSPGLSYTIYVVATYYTISTPHTISGTTSITTSNPQGGGGGPNPPNPCDLRLLNGLTFLTVHPDGTPWGEGEILISWTPLLNDPTAAPPAAQYRFRYRLAGNSTWIYTDPVSVFGLYITVIGMGIFL